MDEMEIVIDYVDDDKFKEGMHEIRVQLWNIKSMMQELGGYRDQLIKLRNDAINNYCDPDNELLLSKTYIPTHIAKPWGD